MEKIFCVDANRIFHKTGNTISNMALCSDQTIFALRSTQRIVVSCRNGYLERH